MNNCIFTIITKDYINYALTLYESLIENYNKIDFYIFCVEDIEENTVNKLENKFNVKFMFRKNILDGTLEPFYEKYKSEYKSKFRWTIKPILIKFLLKKYEKVLYCDPDLYFVNDYSFLFKLLDKHPVILTPHWRTKETESCSLFKDGIYNAGFIGCNRQGIKAMDWWAECNLWKCEKNHEEGLHDDQKYLDAFPAMFQAYSIQHKGCNLSGWNNAMLKKEIKNGKLIIDNIYEPVFFHISGSGPGYGFESEEYMKKLKEKLEETKII